MPSLNRDTCFCSRSIDIINKYQWKTFSVSSTRRGHWILLHDQRLRASICCIIRPRSDSRCSYQWLAHFRSTSRIQPFQKSLRCQETKLLLCFGITKSTVASNMVLRLLQNQILFRSMQVPHFAFSVVSISLLTVCAVNVPNKLVWLGAALPTGLHWYGLISRLGDTGAGRWGSHFPMYYLPPPPMSLSLFIEILFGIGREAKLLIFFHFRIVWDFLLLSVAAHMTMNANYSRVHRLTIATSHNLIATSIESPHAISGKLEDWERVHTGKLGRSETTSLANSIQGAGICGSIK